MGYYSDVHILSTEEVAQGIKTKLEEFGIRYVSKEVTDAEGLNYSLIRIEYIKWRNGCRAIHDYMIGLNDGEDGDGEPNFRVCWIDIGEDGEVDENFAWLFEEMYGTYIYSQSKTVLEVNGVTTFDPEKLYVVKGSILNRYDVEEGEDIARLDSIDIYPIMSTSTEGQHGVEKVFYNKKDAEDYVAQQAKNILEEDDRISIDWFNDKSFSWYSKHLDGALSIEETKIDEYYDPKGVIGECTNS